MVDDIRWVKTHCARMDHGGCALNNELGKALTAKKYWYDEYNELLDILLAPPI